MQMTNPVDAVEHFLTFWFLNCCFWCSSLWRSQIMMHSLMTCFHLWAVSCESGFFTEKQSCISESFLLLDLWGFPCLTNNIWSQCQHTPAGRKLLWKPWGLNKYMYDNYTQWKYNNIIILHVNLTLSWRCIAIWHCLVRRGAKACLRWWGMPGHHRDDKQLHTLTFTPHGRIRVTD